MKKKHLISAMLVLMTITLCWGMESARAEEMFTVENAAAEEATIQKETLDLDLSQGLEQGTISFLASNEDRMISFLKQEVNCELEGRNTLTAMYASNYHETGLNALERSLYNSLKQMAYDVVYNGASETTGYSMSLQDYLGKHVWTAADLGMDIPMIDDIDLAYRIWYEEVFEKSIDFTKVVYAVLRDCPSEFYWVGLVYNNNFEGGISYAYDRSIGDYTIDVGELGFSITFSVAWEYAVDLGGGYYDNYCVDVSKTAAVRSAIYNVKSIVQEASQLCSNDFEILKYYKDEICRLTDYNYDAVYYGVPYGNPWQLIYVFDGDSSTKVVCEGYSKAFQYLCELTSFKNKSVYCTTVDGWMDGGAHMWNIVHMEDNRRYLVDVTNCDGRIEPDVLFMVTYSKGDRENGYWIPFYSDYLVYQYNQNTFALYSEEALTLSPYPYGYDYKNGLVLEEGAWKYYKKGSWDQNNYGFIDYEGNRFLVANGYLAPLDGLVQDPQGSVLDWYFCSEGRIVQNHSGFCEYDGEWFLVKNGKLVSEATGFYAYDGGLFYMAEGRKLNEANGLMQDPITGEWYFCSLGQAQTQYSGLALYNEVWFYVQNGYFDPFFTGIIEYQGTRFYIENGTMIREATVDDFERFPIY